MLILNCSFEIHSAINKDEKTFSNTVIHSLLKLMRINHIVEIHFYLPTFSVNLWPA